LILSGILVFILLATRIVLTSVRQLLLLLQGRAFNIRVVNEFYSSLFSLPKLFFDSRKTGDFVARLNDTMRIQRVIADITGLYLIDFLIIIAIIISIFIYSAGVGLIVLVSLPFFYITVSSRNARLSAFQNSMMQGYSVNESNFIDTLKGMDQIRNLNWNDHYILKNRSIYSDYQDRILNLGKLKVKLNLVVGLCGSFFLLIILIYSSYEVIRSHLTQGELMAIVSLVSTLLPSVINMALLGIPVSEARVAMNRMFELTGIRKEEDPASDSSSVSRIESLRLNGISFRYPGQRTLLENIDLIVRRGEVVSLVGENGCGKSTLANIILRFYRSEEGTLSVNGGITSDLIPLKEWRSRIGLIPQEIHIFNGTILQNLVTDYSEENIKDVVSVVSDLGLDDFIKSFPTGYLTLIGEEGINLSGGQKQLLAYIRALIAKPDILIIDEGTSNMDTKAEGMIIDLLGRLKRDIGILMITHRLNLVKKLSNTIYIISDRTISCMGDHETLLQTDNFYKRYWDPFY
jgi:ATP-binding cassette, subfamily C, bacteriocin exporter